MEEKAEPIISMYDFNLAKYIYLTACDHLHDLENREIRDIISPVAVFRLRLISFRRGDILNFFPNPRRQRRAEIVTKLDVQVVIAIVGHVFHGNLGLTILLERLNRWTQ